VFSESDAGIKIGYTLQIVEAASVNTLFNTSPSFFPEVHHNVSKLGRNIQGECVHLKRSRNCIMF